MSGWIIVAAGTLCGSLAFFVALPLAMSSPFPVPAQRQWVVEQKPQQVAALAPAPVPESRPAYQLASLTSVPVKLTTLVRERDPEAVPAPANTDIGARFRDTWAVLTAPWDPDEAIQTVPAVVVASISDPPLPRQTARALAALPQEPEHTGSITPVSLPLAPDAPAPGIKLAPADPVVEPPKRASNPMDEVDQYLWDVYRRAATKKDSSGDFTWKDPAAAKKMNLSLEDYVIRGMDRDFREQLFAAGKKMDEAGLNWSMLSAFRDNYRQQIASGLKASACNSQHGGTCATGGYSHGRAIDITNTNGGDEQVYRWIDRNGAKYGLFRPMPGYDPAHIQPRGDWHHVAITLRQGRTGETEKEDESSKAKVATRRGRGRRG